MKKFIITIDTEGDNLWEYSFGDEVKTENAKYIFRFQNLCEKFKFKPVYLTNYEMAKNEFFVEFAKDKQYLGKCEIGMHLHAWNNPPYFELGKSWTNYGMPYLIEYPKNIMREKFSVQYELLCEKFGIIPISHRSGRWAMNQYYFDLLIEFGIKIDCSVTPLIDWKASKGYTFGSVGSDYRKYPQHKYIVKHSENEGSVWEFPLTVKRTHKFSLKKDGSIIRKILSCAKGCVLGKNIRLCPASQSMQDMLYVIDRVQSGDDEYLMFMMHSSEMMPSGSPSFKTKESIERLYVDLEYLFEKISGNFESATFIEMLKKEV